MTQRTRLISYLLYGPFSAILKTNTIKSPEVIFHIRLHALRLSSSLILNKYLYAKYHNARSLQGNNAPSVANQSVHTIVAIALKLVPHWGKKKSRVPCPQSTIP